MALRLKENPESNSRTARSVTAPGGLRCDINMDKHSIVIDEPPVRGGNDEGASPLYHFCASLSACQTVQVVKVAEAMRLKFGEIKIDTTLQTGKGEGREELSLILRCLGVEMNISIETDAASAKIDRLKQLAVDRCPIGALIEDAGVELSIAWTILPLPMNNNLELTEK